MLEINPSSRKVRLHDLLRDLISAELGRRSTEAHQALLKAYRSMWKGIGWHTTSDDGYLYDHLGYHLHAANAFDELKALFANQHWLHKRVPQRSYTYDGYLSDLMLTWRCVHSEARRQIEAGQELTDFTDCNRYLLIRTSMNGIAGNYVPELVARAIDTGLWAPDQAMSVVTKIPEEEKRAKMCISLLKVIGLSREQQREVQWVGWKAALAVPDDWERASTLAKLAPQLTGPLLERALEAVLALPNDWGQRVKALIPFLSIIEDQGLLVHSIRQAMLDYSWSMQFASRRDVLDRYFVEEVLTSPIFSPQTLGIIASHIIEICGQWGWL